MDDAELKGAVQRLLASWGFAVEQLDESDDSKSPDLLAAKDGISFVFELKHRFDNLLGLAEERRRLEAGEIISRAESAGRINRISGIVRHGVEQLRSYTDTHGAFRLVWLHAGGRDPELQFEQFRATLYGMTNIVDLDSPHNIRCYYFTHSDFYRWRDSLVGAVLSSLDHVQLCLNTCSPQLDEFRLSPLVQTLASGLLDPEVLERKGAAFIADCAIDRDDKAEILGYIQGKYGRPRLMDLNMSKFTARMLVSRNDSEQRE